MTDTLARLLAGGLLILVAAFAGIVGYRIGKRRGMREASEMSDVLEEAYRSEQSEPRPPRPQSPPSVMH